jgi:hypothetical protein
MAIARLSTQRHIMKLNEELRFFDRLAAHQQWTNHDLYRGDKGKIKLDQLSELSARINFLQSNSSKANK